MQVVMQGSVNFDFDLDDVAAQQAVNDAAANASCSLQAWKVVSHRQACKG
jgi:hypothetical protein